MTSAKGLDRDGLATAPVSLLMATACTLRDMSVRSDCPPGTKGEMLEILDELLRRGWDASPYNGFSFQKGKDRVSPGLSSIQVLCCDAMEWIEEEDRKVKTLMKKARKKGKGQNAVGSATASGQPA